MSKIPTSGVKAHPDGNDYLSEVNTHNSDLNYRSDSDASADFIASARTLEQGFKYKFRILRNAYEERLVNLSQIVESSFGALINEEIGSEMRNDPTTLGYLPAHLAEVFTSHLHDEREAFLADTLQKLSHLEAQAARKDEIVDETLAKMERLQAEVNESRHKELEMDPLRYRLKELETEVTRRKNENDHLAAELRKAQTALDSHSSQQDMHETYIKTRRSEFMDLEQHCIRYLLPSECLKIVMINAVAKIN